MADQNGVPNQCWRNLLCLAQSANDGSSAEPSQMPQQDREFVEKAMAEAVHATDPVRQMYEHIAKLKAIDKPSEEDAKEVEAVADDLEDLICDIDCAVDFCKLGGLIQLIRLLKSDCDSVRCSMARLIPSLAQNNPNVQDVILSSDLLPYLLAIIKDAGISEDLRVKSFSGVSSIVRAHEKAFGQFCKLNGLETIVEAFQAAVKNNQMKAANKAALITTSIAHDLGPDYKWLLSIAEAEKYNMLSILLRMTMQLPSDSAASSYVVDYLIGSIGGDGVGTNKFANGECRKRFLQLEPQHQEQFLIILKKQLECERQNGDPVPLECIMKSILEKDSQESVEVQSGKL